MAATIQPLSTRAEPPVPDERALARRLAPLYVGAMLQSFVLWYAIEKPFPSQIGLTQTRMAALAVVLSLVLVVSNVPLGILADRWSRLASSGDHSRRSDCRAPGWGTDLRRPQASRRALSAASSCFSPPAPE